jgi:raffinose/stachyose/melibiose transport system permease protein
METGLERKKWPERPLFSPIGMSKLSVALTSFQGQTEINRELICAGAVIQILPIVLLTFLAQRYIVAGLTQGSVKG